MSLLQGHEWTVRTDERGLPVNIEDQSPARRVFTRRVLAAWSAADRQGFDALLLAAFAEPKRRREFLRDLFEFTVDWAEQLAERAGNPRTIVAQMTGSIRKEGLRLADWNS